MVARPRALAGPGLAAYTISVNQFVEHHLDAAQGFKDSLKAQGRPRPTRFTTPRPTWPRCQPGSPPRSPGRSRTWSWPSPPRRPRPARGHQEVARPGRVAPLPSPAITDLLPRRTSRRPAEARQEHHRRVRHAARTSTEMIRRARSGPQEALGHDLQRRRGQFQDHRPWSRPKGPRPGSGGRPPPWPRPAMSTAAKSLIGKVDAIYLPTDNTVTPALESVIRSASRRRCPAFGHADLREARDRRALGSTTTSTATARRASWPSVYNRQGRSRHHLGVETQ